jgi:hypothetical protein
MNGIWRSQRIAAGLSIVLLAGNGIAQTEKESDAPPFEDLGEQRYRIGEIIVDKAAFEVSVPGKVLHLTAPLEYLAVSTGGMKSYESLLELSTSPTEFNLACILIGLDDENSVKPRYQFDERKVEGQAVSITISWLDDGETVRVSGANAMNEGEETFDDEAWVYIGSFSSEGGEFMADVTGTLIGFVHDPDSVIDHRNGAGIGAYGLLTGNEKVMPPEGTAVTLTVSVVRP